MWSTAAQPEGVPDEIVVDATGTPDAQLTAVERGRADVVGVPPLGRLQEIRTRYAAQLHITPVPWTWFLILNTHRPPFDDPRARAAVALAVDRGRLVNGFDARGDDVRAPTCQLLPPNFPGYRPYCPHTLRPTVGGAWTGPDLERARALVASSGTKGMPVDVLGVEGEKGDLLAEMTTVLDETLRQLGYRTAVRRLPFDDYFSQLGTGAGRVEAAVIGVGMDYPSPGNFILNVLSCSGEFPYSCRPALVRKLEETAKLYTGNTAAANEAWARLERQLVDQAIVVPVITPKAIDFVSKRVGNYQRHPLYGMLVGQVWVR